MFNPLEEEYLLLERRNVLPEFLIQFKYARRRKAKNAGSPTRSSPAKSARSSPDGERNGGDDDAERAGPPPAVVDTVPCDLSSAELPLPPQPLQSWASPHQVRAARGASRLSASPRCA